MNKKKFFASLICTILAVAVILGGLATANMFAGMSLPDGISQLLDRTTSDKMNILVLGLDKEAKRADVIMLVAVDPDKNEIDLLSIPRDTRVEVSDGKYDKINHTMGYKNPEETIIRVIKNLTGMPIHYYCEVSFEGFRNFIDAIDGVEFDVPVNMDYEDPAQDLSIHLKKGVQVLDGKQAEGVVRFRNTYARADLQRIDVQQDFLKALFEQKLTPKYIMRAPSIIKEVYDDINTNLSVSTAIKYSRMLKKLNADSLSTFVLPGTPKTIGGVSYVVPNEKELDELVLTEFGYPEDKAAELEKQQKQESKSTKGKDGPVDELE